MVKFACELWSAFWLPVWVTDMQLMRLCHLNQHRLIELSIKLHDNKAAIKDNKQGRLWNLRVALPVLISG